MLKEALDKTTHNGFESLDVMSIPPYIYNLCNRPNIPPRQVCFGVPIQLAKSYLGKLWCSCTSSQISPRCKMPRQHVFLKIVNSNPC